MLRYNQNVGVKLNTEKDSQHEAYFKTARKIAKERKNKTKIFGAHQIKYVNTKIEDLDDLLSKFNNYKTKNTIKLILQCYNGFDDKYIKQFVFYIRNKLKLNFRILLYEPGESSDCIDRNKTKTLRHEYRFIYFAVKSEDVQEFVFDTSTTDKCNNNDNNTE